MSDLFSIYEDSLNIVLKNITTITEHMNNLSKEKAESAIFDGNNNLKEADRIVSINLIKEKLKQMELEASTEKNQKSNLHAVKVNLILNYKFRNYIIEAQLVKKRFLKIQENYINQKSTEALLIEGIECPNRTQKQKLIENEEISWNTHDNLEKGKRKAIEIENVSYDIMLNLDKQSNQMKTARENLFHLNSKVDKSDSLVTRMLQRENRNKMYIILLSIVLITLFILFLFFKFY